MQKIRCQKGAGTKIDKYLVGSMMNAFIIY